MAIPSTKDIKKLAKACRLSGVKTIKFEGLEITLADHFPEKSPKSSKKQLSASLPEIEADPEQPSKDELLYWSVMTGQDAEGDTGESN